MNTSCEQFGIRISNQQIQTKARVLPPPCIQYNAVSAAVFVAVGLDEDPRVVQVNRYWCETETQTFLLPKTGAN